LVCGILCSPAVQFFYLRVPYYKFYSKLMVDESLVNSLQVSINVFTGKGYCFFGKKSRRLGSGVKSQKLKIKKSHG
ncbi:MAG TPA: hypothetical protein VIQ00_00940, partial [Chitinophagaceae bacterium]